ncbi:hypothetical protein EDB85DRAFT_1860858, partial [Lactarius pseudohatsudake]
LQSRVRTPWLDTYFLHTSTLGTHTFFLVFLPAFFFFGHDDLGRVRIWSQMTRVSMVLIFFGRLCYDLAFGVYMSSYLLKDLVCSPRPCAPLVVRLTVGNHHLEYGLPSTHSTNSTSMAWFLGTRVYDLHRLGISTTAFATWVVVLFVYVFSIVVGRLYTGMQGFMDCSVGIILRIISWLDSTTMNGNENLGKNTGCICTNSHCENHLRARFETTTLAPSSEPCIRST